jgi:hypothetical protein
VTFVGLNVRSTATAPAVTIAQQLVEALQQAGVQFVAVLGAAHLPGVEPGRMHAAPCVPGSDGSAAMAAPAMLKDAPPLPGAYPSHIPLMHACCIEHVQARLMEHMHACSWSTTFSAAVSPRAAELSPAARL